MATPLFKFRLSDDERTSWQEQADLCDMSLSEWIREHCNAAVSRSVVSVYPVESESVIAPPISSKVSSSHHPTCSCNMCRIACGEIKDPGVVYG